MKGLIIARVASTANGQTMGRRHVSRVGELAGQSDIFYLRGAVRCRDGVQESKRKISGRNSFQHAKGVLFVGHVLVRDRPPPVCSLSKFYEEVFA